MGSDVDLVAVVSDARSRDYDTSGLPVRADLLVYTQAELAQLLREGNPFARRLMAEARWVFERGEAPRR